MESSHACTIFRDPRDGSDPYLFVEVEGNPKKFVMASDPSNLVSCRGSIADIDMEIMLPLHGLSRECKNDIQSSM